MAVVLFAVALLVAVWSGLGLTLLLWGRTPRRLPGPGELFCLSFLLGTGNVVLMMELAGLFTTRVPVVTVVECVLLGSAGIVLRRSTLMALARRRPTTRDLAWALATIAAMTMAGSVLLWFTVHTSLEWDGLTVWYFKAELAANHHGRIPPEYYSGPTVLWSAPNHPVYLPLLSSWIFGWMGHTSEYAIKLLFPLHLLAAAGLIGSAANRLTGRRGLAVLAPLLLLAAPALVHGAGSAASGYADVATGAFYLMGVVAATEFLQHGDVHALRMLAASGAVLPLVKMEGTYLVGIVLLVVAAVLCIRARRATDGWRAIRRSLVQLAAPVVVVAGLWRMVLGSRHVNVTGDMLPVTPHNLLTHLDRTGVLLGRLLRELTNWDRWSVLWVWVVLALVLWTVTRAGHQRVVLPLLLLAPMALDVGVFYFSSWRPVTAHVDSTLYRLLIHVTPVAVLLILLSFPTPPARPRRHPVTAVTSPG